MNNRWLAKIAAVVSALCLAVAVMSGIVFAWGDSSDELSDQTELPEATFVVLDGASEEAEQPAEVTDNRSSVPYYINDVLAGQCPIIGGEPYVSVSEFCEALGLAAELSVSGADMQLMGEGLSLTASADVPYIVCNGRYFYLENGPQSVDGEPALPVEDMVKCLGVTASWDRVSWAITVRTDNGTALEDGDTYYSETDVYWLSRLIYAEASDQPLTAQIAVGRVVLNRAESEAFAGQDTVYDVIFAKNQFDVVINGMIYMTPDENAIIAAKLALEGYDLAEGGTYFTYGTARGTVVAQFGDMSFLSAA